MGLTSGLLIEARTLLTEDMPKSNVRPTPAIIPNRCNTRRRDRGMLNHCWRSINTFLSKLAQKRQSRGISQKRTRAGRIFPYLLFVAAGTSKVGINMIKYAHQAY